MSDFRSSAANAIWRCSTSPSTASFAVAILSACEFDDIAIGGHVRDPATIIQHKTGRPVQFEITEQTRASLQDWLTARPAGRGPYLFPSRVHNQPHLTARQYARIVRGWIEGAGIDSSGYGTHSLRRTKVAQIYSKIGNLRAVQLLLGHTKIESTVRYLGIELEDALTLSERVRALNDRAASRACCKRVREVSLPRCVIDPLPPLRVGEKGAENLRKLPLAENRLTRQVRTN